MILMGQKKSVFMLAILYKYIKKSRMLDAGEIIWYNEKNYIMKIEGRTL